MKKKVEKIGFVILAWALLILSSYVAIVSWDIFPILDGEVSGTELKTMDIGINSISRVSLMGGVSSLFVFRLFDGIKKYYELFPIFLISGLIGVFFIFQSYIFEIKVWAVFMIILSLIFLGVSYISWKDKKILKKSDWGFSFSFFIY